MMSNAAKTIETPYKLASICASEAGRLHEANQGRDTALRRPRGSDAEPPGPQRAGRRACGGRDFGPGFVCPNRRRRHSTRRSAGPHLVPTATGNLSQRRRDFTIDRADGLSPRTIAQNETDFWLGTLVAI